MPLDEQFWMVWNPEGNAPTMPHDSEAGAIREAERLARAHMGQRFYVLHGDSYVERNDLQHVNLPMPIPF